MGTVVPIAISVETPLTRAFPGRAVTVRYIQRGSCEAMHLVKEIRLDLRYTLPQWYGYAD